MSDTSIFLLGATIVAIVVIIKLFRDHRKKVEEEAVLAYATATENAARVREIIYSCHRDLNKQRAAGYGPWLSSLLDGAMFTVFDESGRIKVETTVKPVSPDVALTAVRRTIEEITSAPVSYDKDGNEMPRRALNLDGLHRAEAELEKMGEGA